VILASVLLAAAASSGGGCATTDLMPQFWVYWDKARGADAGERYCLFQEMVEKPNAAVYEGAFHGAQKPPSEFVPKALAQVHELEPGMRELSAKLAADLPGELDAFRKAFPRFRCEVPVYFLFSAGAFDGATREISGRNALLFGLDVIAKLKEELSPLVVHELFHVYQDEVIANDPGTISWALWQEGLATYVSRRLNPGVPEQKVCCLPAIDPVGADLPRISKELLGLLDSKERTDYARFFLGGQEIDIPARSGYYVGYLVASEAGKTRSLEELAAMSPAEVRAVEEKELRRLASGSPAAPR
jgi:Predicted Zn-dependent protease (DUF2268)